MPDLAHAEPGWYCYQALPKKEHVAATLINTETELKAFCPRIRYLKKTKRGKVHFVEPLFPGYLFVHCHPKEHYRWVISTQGVRRLVVPRATRTK